jgi:hypothetical protein
MQETVTTNKERHRFTVRRESRERKNRYKDKLISIVQASKGINSKPYLSTHCSVTIPHALSKLVGIHHGSLISWELLPTEHNAFILRAIPDDEEIGDQEN